MNNDTEMPYILWAETPEVPILWSINTGIEQARKNEGTLLEDADLDDEATKEQ